jgi:hypothetical protein
VRRVEAREVRRKERCGKGLVNALRVGETHDGDSAVWRVNKVHLKRETETSGLTLENQPRCERGTRV